MRYSSATFFIDGERRHDKCVSTFSRELFADLSISKCPSFEEHLNKYLVMFIDMSKMVSMFKYRENIVDLTQDILIEELLGLYPNINSDMASQHIQGYQFLSHICRCVYDGNFPRQKI